VYIDEVKPGVVPHGPATWLYMLYLQSFSTTMSNSKFARLIDIGGTPIALILCNSSGDNGRFD
jgi:hypothetical protein